jgi:hypothetical protein
MLHSQTRKVKDIFIDSGFINRMAEKDIVRLKKRNRNKDIDVSLTCAMAIMCVT